MQVQCARPHGPYVFSAVLGLVLEGHISVLHIGPPCSSFSQAFNRFKAQQVRNSEYPMGLPNLNAAQQNKVDIGNRLAEVTVTP